MNADRKTLFVLVTLAAAFRLGFFLLGLRQLPYSSDEAWPTLMAHFMLKGEFPVVYWGQSYMGTQESMFQALLIPFFGLSKAAMRLYALLHSALFVLISCELARRIYGDRTARITLALLAVPVPYLTLCGVILAPDNYLALTTLGSLSLLLLHDLVFGERPGRTVTYALLGFVLGYAFWLHILVAGYLGVALLFIFLNDKLFFFRKGFWTGVAAFVAGGLPLWAYNLRFNFITFREVGQTVDWPHTIQKVRVLFDHSLHFLIGMKLVATGDSHFFVSLPKLAAGALGAVWVLGLLVALACHAPSLLRLGLLTLRRANAGVLLIASAVASVAVCAHSFRFSSVNVRYILPILSALPVLFAYGLERIRRVSKVAFFVLMAFVMASQAWGNVLLARLLNDPRVIAEKLNLPDTAQLRAFLREQGIDHVYAHYWLSYRLMLESGVRMVCSEPYNMRFPGHEVKFIDQVRASTNAAYIVVHQPRFKYPPFIDFEEALRNLRVRFEKKDLGWFTVYYHFDYPPLDGFRDIVEIPRAGWGVAACEQSHRASLALDGARDTSWMTARTQESNMWFTVDTGRTQEICRLRMDNGGWFIEHPRGGRRIDTSLDGRDWTTVEACDGRAGDFYWSDSHPFFWVVGDPMTVTFPPTTARHVRITLTHIKPSHLRWRISEIHLDEAVR